MNLMWTVFFVSMGAINLYVMYQFDTDTWVNFKFYGVLGLTLVFMVVQGFYLARYMALMYDDGSTNGVAVPFSAALDPANAKHIIVTHTSGLISNSSYRLILKSEPGSRRTVGLEIVTQDLTFPN